MSHHSLTRRQGVTLRWREFPSLFSKVAESRKRGATCSNLQHSHAHTLPFSAMASSLSDSIPPSTVPRQLSFLLPRTHSTTVHLHMTLSTHSLVLFLTSQTPETSSQKAPLGSFVYALPDVCFSLALFLSFLIPAPGGS